MLLTASAVSAAHVAARLVSMLALPVWRGCRPVRRRRLTCETPGSGPGDRVDRGGGCRATCPGSAPHTSTVVVEPSRARAFRLVPAFTGTYGCGSAPDLDRLSPHAAIAR